MRDACETPAYVMFSVTRSMMGCVGGGGVLVGCGGCGCSEGVVFVGEESCTSNGGEGGVADCCSWGGDGKNRSRNGERLGRENAKVEGCGGCTAGTVCVTGGVMYVVYI